MVRFRGRLLALAAVAALLAGCSATSAADSNRPGKPLQLRLVISSAFRACTAPRITSAGRARACDAERTTTYTLARSLGTIRPTSVELTRVKHAPNSVTLEFDRADAKTLGDATRRAIGTQLAIVLDGRVLTAPQVMAALTSGELVLAFGTTREAKRVAAQLRAPHTG